MKDGDTPYKPLALLFFSDLYYYYFIFSYWINIKGFYWRCEAESMTTVLLKPLLAIFSIVKLNSGTVL